MEFLLSWFFTKYSKLLPIRL